MAKPYHIFSPFFRFGIAAFFSFLIPWLIDRRWLGARSSGIARTRFIDDTLLKTLQEGIQQVVILGAGFDCRAYRIKHKLLGSTTDLPLLVVHTNPPCNVEFPELQFSVDGKASLKQLPAGPQDGIQDIDTESDRWYLLPGRG